MAEDKIINRDISELIFDSENPRLPSYLRKPGIKDRQIFEWMIENENVTALMGSIAEKGFFPAEPLLIVKKKNKFEVVEGNRRLAAVKLLNDPKQAPKKIATIKEIIAAAKPGCIMSEVPTLLFDDKDELQIFLGYRHITGIKAWDALAKARYLKSLQKVLKFKNKEEEFKSLARIIGSDASYVKNILKGLAVWEVIEKNDFFRIHGLNETSVDFGVLYTAVGRENISWFVGVDINSPNPVSKVKIRQLKELTSWMFEKGSENMTRLGESRNLQELDKVVRNTEALNLFRKGVSLSEAATLTDAPVVAFTKSILKSKDQLLIAQSQINRINKPSENELNLATSVNQVAKDVVTLIRAKIEDE